MKPYQYATADMGLAEIQGEVDEPRIVQMFADAGHSWVQDDETAWCAAAMCSWLKRAGLPHTGKLNARSYLDYGTPVSLDDAKTGDIVVFWRGSKDSWQGHVGFFVRRAGASIIVRGGNQSNMVKDSRYPVDRLLGVRRHADVSAAPDSAPNPIATIIELLTKLFGGKQ